MTYVAKFLNDYFDRTGTNQTRFAEKAKTDDGHISRILRGQRTQIREATLNKLLAALPVKERAAFLYACWLDNTPPQHHHLIPAPHSASAALTAAAASTADPEFAELEEDIRKTFKPLNRGRIIRTLRAIAKASKDEKFLQAMELFTATK